MLSDCSMEAKPSTPLVAGFLNATTTLFVITVTPVNLIGAMQPVEGR
jgi:hypothetical protein